jgi:hypothetical protein
LLAVAASLVRCRTRLLFARSRHCSGLKVELSFALLVEHALAPEAAATPDTTPELSAATNVRR